LNNSRLSVVKGSAAEIYDFDLDEFAETGKFVFSPLTLDVDGVKCKEYAVKTLTQKGEDAGSLLIYVKDGEVNKAYHFFSQTYADQYGHGLENNKEYWASLSYADHAERIRVMFDLPEIIPPENVRLIYIAGNGPAFYVNTGKTEAVVWAGFTAKDPSAVISGKAYYTPEELRTLVQRYVEERNDLQSRMDAYFTEHPDETVYPYEGGSQGISVQASSASGVQNVIDIKGFFGVSDEPEVMTATEGLLSARTAEDVGGNGALLAACIASLVAAAALTAVLVVKKKLRRAA